MRCRHQALYAVLSRPQGFAERSGLYPLAEAIGAQPCLYRKWWPELMRFSWRLGNAVRRWGQDYYGSEWNALVPVLHDAWLHSRIKPGPSIAHFLFAEFASPRSSVSLRRRGATVIGTFHASVRRQEQVHGQTALDKYDWITVVSNVQIPFFLDRGYPAERIRVTHHGVDTHYFCPLRHPRQKSGDPLRLLLVGSTERDHSFMSTLCRQLSVQDFEVTLLTSASEHHHYAGIDCVRIPGRLPDSGLLEAYQRADLLVMPMLDCTANNAVLEAMACGTPVITNRVGGAAEYVAESCNYLMNGKHLEEWLDQLMACRRDVDLLWMRRSAVRAWAETFDWSLRAQPFLALYEEALHE